MHGKDGEEAWLGQAEGQAWCGKGCGLREDQKGGWSDGHFQKWLGVLPAAI